MACFERDLEMVYSTLDVEEDADERAALSRIEVEFKAVEAEVERLRAVVDYAANMPDSETMPEWAKELRHYARQALEGHA
jgi:hypothetical protein